MKRWQLSFVFFVLLLQPARAQQTECFDFISTQTPSSDSLASLTRENWCYEPVRKNQYYIYYAENARPELAALVETNTAGAPIWVTHFSLHQGQHKVHSVEAAVNPITPPLSLEEARLHGLPTKTPFFLDARILWTKAKLLAHHKLKDFSSFRLRTPNQKNDATIEAYLPDEQLPWTGYLWMQNGEMYQNPDSPLVVYDQLVKATYNRDLNSTKWESENHNHDTVSWGGHCNGWAAASVLYPEPATDKWSTKLDREIPNWMQKAWLTEISFCVHLAFYGSRNRDRETDDPKDIHADRFHKVIIYYIDKLKKPVVMDYYPNAHVDNNVVTGFHFFVEKTATPLKFKVSASLRMHRYYNYYDHPTGIAQEYTRTYQYYLTTDLEGRITSGEWISTNPDFIWAPLSPKRCGRDNPYMSDIYVNDLIQNLPENPNSF